MAGMGDETRANARSIAAGVTATTAGADFCGDGDVAGSESTSSTGLTEVSAQHGIGGCTAVSVSCTQHESPAHTGNTPAATTIITAKVRTAARAPRWIRPFIRLLQPAVADYISFRVVRSDPNRTYDAQTGLLR